MENITLPSPPERGKTGEKTGSAPGKWFRRHLVTGLLILAPIVVTVWASLWLFQLVDNILGNLIRPILPFPIPGLGLILLVILIIGIGWIARMRLGAILLDWLEVRISRIPIASWVYSTASQITQTTIQNKQQMFSRCVLLEYPRKGCWAMGFITANAPREFNRKLGLENELRCVFVPTTPNPTSGFILFLPAADIVELDIPIDVGFRLIISGGTVETGQGEETDRRVTLRELISRL